MLSNAVSIEGVTATECVWKESSDIKSRRRRRRKVEALNSMQIVSFLLFIGAKMRRRREAMRIENLLVVLTFKKDARTTMRGAGRLLEWGFDGGRSSGRRM